MSLSTPPIIQSLPCFWPTDFPGIKLGYRSTYAQIGNPCQFPQITGLRWVKDCNRPMMTLRVSEEPPHYARLQRPWEPRNTVTDQGSDSVSDAALHPSISSSPLAQSEFHSGVIFKSDISLSYLLVVHKKMTRKTQEETGLSQNFAFITFQEKNKYHIASLVVLSFVD